MRAEGEPQILIVGKHVVTGRRGVEGDVGLGNASVNLALGQSWSLQGLEANVDNSAITSRVLSLMDHGASLLTSLSPVAAAAVPGALAGCFLEPTEHRRYEQALIVANSTNTLTCTNVGGGSEGFQPVARRLLADAGPLTPLNRRLWSDKIGAQCNTRAGRLSTRKRDFVLR